MKRKYFTSPGMDGRDAVAAACFFLSGCAGLIYEVCWIRKASLVFGSTTYAMSTVLSVFFLGLAGGNYAFGRISLRTERPLRVFAVMEFAVGLLAFGSFFAFGLLNSLYGMAYRAAGEASLLLLLVRVALVSVVLLPPSFIMGGTLPLFCRQYVNEESRIARWTGFLYGLNTLGAAAGCALAGLVLIPSVGIFGAICVGAVLNLAVSLTIGLLGRGIRVRTAAEYKGGTIKGGGHPVISAVLFLSGFVALGNEVLWMRHLTLLIRNSVYTYTLTLTAVLIGIVAGSAAAALSFDRSGSRPFWFGFVQVAIGILTLGLMLIPASFWAGFGPLPLSIYFFLLVPPAILAGAAFPLGIRMALDDPVLAGISVGRLSAVNTFGGILGSLLVGFVFLPLLGRQSTLLITTGMSLAAGVSVWVLLERQMRPGRRWAAAAASVLVWLIIPFASGTRLPADFLLDKGKGGELIAYREGLSSDLAVIRAPRGEKVMEINRLWQGQDKKNHQIMAAHVPMLLRSYPQSVLLVGAGAGQTASRFLMYSIKRLDCVDIEPAVFDVIRDHFDSAWMNDKRVRLLREDGRNYLNHTGELYDVISIEVGQISRPGVPFFYTTEFYEQASRRLTPGGFLVQFVPLPFFPADQFRSVVATFLKTFPQSFLWYNREEMLLIGVNAPVLHLRGERLALLDDNNGWDNEVRHDLRISLLGPPEYGLQQRFAFLGSFISGPRGLAELSGGAPIYHDDRPVLDYAVYHVKMEDTNEVQIAALLRNHLDPIEDLLDLKFDGPERTAIEKVRELDLEDLVKSALRRRKGVPGYAAK